MRLLATASVLATRAAAPLAAAQSTTKWTHPPFAAARDGGYVYGRGAVDDKDNVTAELITMLLLKRFDVRMLPDEDPERFLVEMKKVGGDRDVARAGRQRDGSMNARC